jgi:hypothetical protein
MSDTTMKLVAGRPNRGTFPVSLTCGDAVLIAGEVNPHKPADIKRFITAAQKQLPALGTRAEELQHELLQLAKPQATHQPQPIEAIDVSRIVRPELFIAPEVCGLTVAEPIIADGRPAGRWQLQLMWRDGRRQSIALADAIELSDGARLWIHPHPSEPSPNLIAGWSAASRRAWRDGAEAPDVADVFRRLCEAIARFIDLPESEAAGITATLGLWVMLTYVFPAWPAVPYLYVGGPLGSGKTRVFEILSRLVFRPLASSNMTAAALFRTLHDRGGTLLMDEAERLRETTPDAGELRSILLAGYKRGGKATRLEPSGDSFKTIEFDCYGPKAIACIGGLPPALMSRSIPVIMFRAAPGSFKPKRRVDAEPELWAGLRDDLHAMVLGPLGLTALALAERTDLCGFGGRDYELWQPLMALAAMIQVAGAVGLVGLVQEHAGRVTEAAQDDQTPDADELLLKLLAEAVQDKVRLSPPTPSEILGKAQHAEPESFRRWSARGVSVHLKRYGITAVKSGGQRLYRDVTVTDLLRIQRHYSIDLGLVDTTGTDPELASFAPQSTPTTPENAQQTAVGVAQGAQGAQKSSGYRAGTEVVEP